MKTHEKLKVKVAQSCLIPGIPQARISERVASRSLLQGIFLTQESNQGLLYCRQIREHNHGDL